MVVNGNFKMCDTLKNDRSWNKTALYLGLGDTSNHIWSTFDLVVFKVIWGSFPGFVSKSAVPPKLLVVG